jgi:LysM repeat protein
VDAARAHRVSLRTLRRLNQLKGEPAVGRVVLVPRVRGRATPENEGELLVIQQPDLRFVIEGRREVFFPIRRRYDLGEIAAFFGVLPGQLALWNGLDPQAALQRGMVLRIFIAPDFDRRTAVLVDPAKAMRLTAGSDAASNVLTHAGKSGRIRRVKHRVRRGQSLWSIAKRYGVTVRAIRASNGLGRRKALSPGQTLMIPKPKSARPRGKAARRAPKRSARGRTSYKVRSGDSLWKIAKKFGVTVKALRRRNGMKRRSRLRPGQRLVIP